ncbi:hypothetical protein BC941DRAFT_519514 [Chlamydoabsidia padenii]|nr:hypothetical protein BC941DRAFT_519514 [Chlamydoabsidia padenii]
MMPVDKNPSSLHSWRHSTHYGTVSYCPSSDPSIQDNGDRRTAHNAIERQRRELLNSKFEQLAHALPGLQNVRRPSKSMIVSKSLEFVTKSVHRDSSYQNKIRQLRKEHDTLRKHTERSQHQLRKRIITNEEQEEKESTKQDSSLTSNKKRPKTSSHLPNNKIHPQQKKKPAVLHKFVHHHASSSKSTPTTTEATVTATATTTTTKSPPPPPTTTTTKPPSSLSSSSIVAPPFSYQFSFVPPMPSQSWPLLDLSAMQHPDTVMTTQPQSFYSPDMLNAFIQQQQQQQQQFNFSHDDPTTRSMSYPDPTCYYWK